MQNGLNAICQPRCHPIQISDYLYNFREAGSLCSRCHALRIKLLLFYLILKWQLVLGPFAACSLSIYSSKAPSAWLYWTAPGNAQSFGARCDAPPHPRSSAYLTHSELFTVPYFLFIGCTSQSSSFANVFENVLRPRHRVRTASHQTHFLFFSFRAWHTIPLILLLFNLANWMPINIVWESLTWFCVADSLSVRCAVL